MGGAFHESDCQGRFAPGLIPFCSSLRVAIRWAVGDATSEPQAARTRSLHFSGVGLARHGLRSAVSWLPVAGCRFARVSIPAPGFGLLHEPAAIRFAAARRSNRVSRAAGNTAAQLGAAPDLEPLVAASPAQYNRACGAKPGSLEPLGSAASDRSRAEDVLPLQNRSLRHLQHSCSVSQTGSRRHN
jgi:hypothetical protein